MDPNSLIENFERVESQITKALLRVHRTRESLQVIAASKSQAPEALKAYQDWCVKKNLKCVFGENYLKEAIQKRESLDADSKLVMIGTLQSNKVREAVALFDQLHSVHSLRLLNLIHKEAQTLGKVMPIYLQINISSDADKSGLQPESLNEVINQAIQLPNIKVLGLMAITKFYPDPADVRVDFKAMNELGSFAAMALGFKPQLNFGMSNDFEIAIEEGATVVRIGSALFGERM